jgi:phenylpropionate dioxygenase-like ring-hydroxylating dioxygenase large terminal subunit
LFISDTHLPQILPPEVYHCEDHYRRELDELFLPGWHCIALTDELAHDGDFITRELFGNPLIMWRSGGDIHTFLNVCPHRFSILSDKQCGNRERLWCPYHGWEFNENGDTCKIPDARSFRPLEKGVLGLSKFRTEVRGHLIFVSLATDSPPLDEYLGSHFDELCGTWFSDEWKLVFSHTRPNRSNWKVSLENSLEGYHNATVHAKTYQGWPDASVCTHELHDECRSTFKVDAESEDDKFITRLGKLAFRLAKTEPEFDFHEIHRYPNLIFAKFSKFTWAEIVIPTSPTDSYDLWYIFVRSGKSAGWRTRALSFFMSIWFKRWFKRILKEDEDMFPMVQAGTSVPRRPGPGLISIREERIFHFQEFLKNATMQGRQLAKTGVEE